MSRRKFGLARLSKLGKKFEIVVDVEKAWLLKSGEKIDLGEVVQGEFVYYDARQGLKASESDLRKAFGTGDFYKIAERIIKEGDLQITAEHRRELIDAKRRQIIEFLSRNAIDPRTGLPHPPKRVELALEEARIGIDPFKPAEAQINDIIKALRPILPIKIASALVAIRIPPQYVGKAYGALAKVGKILRSTYLSDGSWSVEMEIPAGIQESLISQVNNLTRGRGEIRILKRG